MDTPAYQLEGVVVCRENASRVRGQGSGDDTFRTGITLRGVVYTTYGVLAA